MWGAEIHELIQMLAKLPGLGPRSARRAALFLLRNQQAALAPLAASLVKAGENIVTCKACGNLDSVSPCHICCDPKRDVGLLCVVEDVADVWALERADAIKGRYHVLGGVLSALDGVTPEKLNLHALKARCESEPITEIIIATNATIEGQSTAHYITDMLASLSLKVSRLAHGVPIGGELDYMDEGTLATAIATRRPFS